ncbi:ABC transporter permease [Natrarchaeobius chitinivorans]|nr:ABC transporter permease [Natrarchaeobius chitinivorans]
MTVLIPVSTVLLALLVSSVALIAVGVNPIVAYLEIFLNPFFEAAHMRRVLNRGAPLILAGLAVYIPLRSGLYNIGAEGQLILGGIVTIWIGVNLPDYLGISTNALSLVVIMFFVSIVVGAAWIFVPYYLYTEYEVNEILTTLMLVFTAEQLSNYLTAGPMSTEVGAFPRTDTIQATLPTFPGSRLNIGIVIAVIMVVATWFLINKTRLGYEIILSGSNEEVARQTGISAAKITFVVFMLAGAFAGLAGFIDMAGNQQTMTIDWFPEYGWTAIPIALLGRRGAFQTMLAALLFSVLITGGIVIEARFGVPSAIAQIIEALVILFLITGEFVRTYKFDIVIGERSMRGIVYGMAGFGGSGGN